MPNATGPRLAATAPIRAAVALQAGRPDHSRRRHPVYDLRDLAHQARGKSKSRVQQIVDWLGPEFDGVVVFDEAHAMANAAGDKSERGEKKPSQQGQAGLRLQHALPDARILYVSATGATTVQNLAYAARLGLWGTGDFPFATRAEFVAAMNWAASPRWRCWRAT